MRRSIQLGVALVVLCVAPLAAQTGFQEQKPQVVGTGTVELLLAPKRALLLLGLTGEGADGQTAVAQVQELQRVASDTLAGIASRIIPWGVGFGENQQVRRMISPTEAGITTSRDYLARAGLAIELEHVDQLALAVAKLASAGVKSIKGVVYLSEETDPALMDATSRATVLARQQAETMAQAAGGRVGGVIRLTTTPAYSQALLARFNWTDQTGVPLTPSEIVVRVTVQGTWEFVSGD